MCKSLLPDELIKRVNPNFLVDNKDPGNNDDDYSNDEDKFDGELPIWIKLHETFVNSLFIQNEKYILCCLPQFCFEVGNKKWFLVLIALFRKLLGYIFNEKSSKMFPKIVLGITVKSKRCRFHSGSSTTNHWIYMYSSSNKTNSLYCP